MRTTGLGPYPDAIYLALGSRKRTAKVIAERIGDTENVVRRQLEALERDGEVSRSPLVCNLGHHHGEAWRLAPRRSRLPGDHNESCTGPRRIACCKAHVAWDAKRAKAARQLAEQGISRAEIARQLGVSTETVKALARRARGYARHGRSMLDDMNTPLDEIV